MADWFSSVQVSEDMAEAIRKQVLERMNSAGSSEFFATPELWEYEGPASLQSPSRRSPVLFRNGGVASSQPLASAVGLELLQKGANAAEASIGVSAALTVTEPCSCGLGGDMFSLYYEASSKQVTAINGSGKSPAGLTLERLRKDCPTSDEFKFSAHAVTVPGAARGWQDLLERHGSGNFTLGELLEPAAKLAEDGFPVAPVASYHWTNGMGQIQKWLDENDKNDNNIPLTVDGKRAPKPGEILRNPDLARVLRELGAKGADEGFYGGSTGAAIVEAVQKHGGVLSLEDLKACESTFPDPISVTYKDVRLWEVPPNGQGIAALIALKGLEALNDPERGGNKAKLGSADYYHKMIEMMRLGFADNRAHVADLECMTTVTPETLLDTERIVTRATKLFDPHSAAIQGAPDPSSCTVSFQVVDKEGNAISFVNSNFMGFGTGIVPKDCGFTLQNRGFGFTIDNDDHPNAYAPSKRPYHTILPGMLTHAENNELYATLSNMGGNMQPQGHMQLTIGMVDEGLDPQAAIDFPRFCIADGTQGGTVLMEAEVNLSTVKELLERGHSVQPKVTGHGRAVFGRAQIIKKDPHTGVWWAGSDGRADGCAMGY